LAAGGEGTLRLGNAYPRKIASAPSMTFLTLSYLYVGTANFERDVAYYRDVLGAELVWNLSGFGAHVAAFRVGGGPLLLLADHRPAPSCMPVYEVADLKKTARTSEEEGMEAGRSRVRDPERSVPRV